MAAHVGQLDIDTDAFPLMANPATTVTRATSVGAGFIWHLNRNMRLSATYDYTFWMNLFNSFRITWRLMWDSRVPFSAKLVPILTVLYILSPIDLIPDLALGLGQLDDVAILLLGTQLFIAVSPKDIVERIRAELEGRPPGGGWTVTGRQPRNSDHARSSASDEIIDG